MRRLTEIQTKYPATICLFKLINNNTRTKSEICSKLTIKTPGQRHRRRSSVFIVKFEHISYLFLIFLLLTLNKVSWVPINFVRIRFAFISLAKKAFTLVSCKS